jgi:hypothetical protein
MTRRPVPLSDDAIAAFLRSRATDPDAGLLDDIVRRASEFPQQRPWFRRQTGAVVRALHSGGLIAVATGAVAVVALAIGAGFLTRWNVGNAPTPSPSPASWTGPLRADAITLPVTPLADASDRFGDRRTSGSLDDASDSGKSWTDIVEVRWSPCNGPEDPNELPIGGVRAAVFCEPGTMTSVDIVLEAPPPRLDALSPTETISYGFVIDTVGDGTPDYEVGISTNPPRGGEFRAWITDLRTGVTEEQLGPPYGYPVEFWHPSDPGSQPRDEESARTMQFMFLPGSDPVGFDSTSRIYAWTLVTRGGEVVAWDYAPDAAWARLPGE